MNTYIAVDVGGTGIKYALMDEEANILDQHDEPTPQESIEDFLERIEAIYHNYAHANPQALVMSAPGRIDADHGYFYTGGALGHLHRQDMKKLLEKRVPIPFALENDAKAAALAELWKGSLKNVNSGLVLTLGTGIGGAVIVDGRLWRGHTFAAGEFSGIPTSWNTRSAIDTNCWTQINCTKSMLDRYACAREVDPAAMDGRKFFEAVNAGDEQAKAELEWFCETLATGLYALQLILDVEKVAIGGGISRQPVLIETLNQTVSRLFDRLPWFSPASKPAVESCTFSNDANLVGALYHYLYELKPVLEKKERDKELNKEIMEADREEEVCE